MQGCFPGRAGVIGAGCWHSPHRDSVDCAPDDRPFGTLRRVTASHGPPRSDSRSAGLEYFPTQPRAGRAPGYRSASVREAHNCVGSKLLRSCHWRPSPSGRQCEFAGDHYRFGHLFCRTGVWQSRRRGIGAGGIAFRGRAIPPKIPPALHRWKSTVQQNQTPASAAFRC
jgi:hypothetical protein